GRPARGRVARASRGRPRVFPCAGALPKLGVKLRVQMRVELKRRHDRLETTAIYVTHAQVEAMTLGDRVVVMKDGWIQQVGEPLTLYAKPRNRFFAGFIGSSGRKFIACHVRGAGGKPEAATARGMVRATYAPWH